MNDYNAIKIELRAQRRYLNRQPVKLASRPCSDIENKRRLIAFRERLGNYRTAQAIDR
ncbi:hypothetical protein [Carnimonas bestiolae]|uniref:hypothetical protein n=1 Tax=Carnimonas bestiolae TaxID=3402172 RepID=UPI003EDC4F8D